MALPILLQGGRLLAGAVKQMMKRYGLKELEGRAARDMKATGARNAIAKARREVLSKARANGLKGKKLMAAARRADASKADKLMATKAARFKQVAGNAGGDAAGSAFNYEMYSSPNDLETYIKKNKPRVWAKYQRSGYSSLREFLEARA